MIMITGASGLIGKALTMNLLDSGETVFGVDTVSSALTHSNYKHLEEAFDSETALGIARKADVVIHLAGASSSGHFKTEGNILFWREIEANLTFFSFLSKNCRNKIVFSSSEWVYGERKTKELIPESNDKFSSPSDLYALTKSLIEKMILLNPELTSRTMILRLGIVLSARRSNLTLIEYLCKKFVENDNSIKVRSGKIGRAYVLLEDLVEMIKIAALDHTNGIFNVGGQSFFSVNDVRSLSEEILNRKLSLLEEEPNFINFRNIDSRKYFDRYNFQPSGPIKIIRSLIDEFGGKSVE